MNVEHDRLCSSPEWAAHLQTDVLPRLAERVDLGADMIEFGPGPGAATDWLRHRVRRLTALEMDATAAASLAGRLDDGNVNVVVGDCTRCNFPDRSFDSVGSFTMLHHTETAASQFAVLAEAYRLLRPHGVFIGSDSVASTPLHHFHADDTYNPVDPARLLTQLQTLGFQEVSVTVGNELTFIAHKPADTETDPAQDRLEWAAATMPLAEPVDVEPPREGEPGGAPCGYCALTDEVGCMVRRTLADGAPAVVAAARWRAPAQQRAHRHAG